MHSVIPKKLVLLKMCFSIKRPPVAIFIKVPINYAVFFTFHVAHDSHAFYGIQTRVRPHAHGCIKI